jgi:hypothetical protein
MLDAEHPASMADFTVKAFLTPDSYWSFTINLKARRIRDESGTSGHPDLRPHLVRCGTSAWQDLASNLSNRRPTIPLYSARRDGEGKKIQSDLSHFSRKGNSYLWRT